MSVNESEALISIIVPVYNCQKTIRKCIKSIISQTFSNIEIIIIDDGSKDESGKICDLFAKADPRIQVIHKNNEGVSTARNTGIQLANGDYICFVDSDDWMSPIAIERLLEKMITFDSDICIGQVLAIESGRDFILRKMDSKEYDLSSEEGLFSFTEIVDWAPWAKLYKKEILDKYHFQFRVDIKSCEDSIFIADFLSECKKATSINEIVYFYNNLNAQTASRKYYELYKEWSLLFAQKYAELFLNFKSSFSREIINRKYILRCYETCSYYCNQNVSVEMRYKDIKETFNLFQPFCDFGCSWSNSNTLEIKKKEVIQKAYLSSNERKYELLNSVATYKKQKLKNIAKFFTRQYKIFRYYLI